MPEHAITDFISGFNGGTRTNRFRIEPSNIGPGAGSYGKWSPFHVRATTIPGAKVGVIPVSYRGRVVNYPGDRTYDPWVVTVLDDVSTQSIFQAFHYWQNYINSHLTNQGQINGKNNFSGADWSVTHLDTNGGNSGTGTKRFTLYNCWPVDVGPIQLDIGQMDTLVTFQVTIVYSHLAVTIP